MTTDHDQGGRAGQGLIPYEAAPLAARIHRGAELVALAERFNHGIFMGSLAFVGLSTLTALAFLPLRASAENGRPPPTAVAAALVVLALTGLAAWRGRDIYRLLRSRPGLQLVPVLIAAALLSVVSPLRNELWWPACAILMVIALQASLRRALGYCLIVLIANLAAHTAAGDLSETSPVGIVGLWIGLPFWTAMAAVIPDRMASHILRLNAMRHPPRSPARRVTADASRASSDAPPNDGSAGDLAAAVRADAGSDGAPPTRATQGHADSTSRLTSRQLEVVALLADGYRYEFIGSCLSITAGQVYRHVRNAIERLEVENVHQLVAVAIAEGLVARSAREPRTRS
jgi:DNA-binding CsgD family transcriptional regulator